MAVDVEGSTGNPETGGTQPLPLLRAVGTIEQRLMSNVALTVDRWPSAVDRVGRPVKQATCRKPVRWTGEVDHEAVPLGDPARWSLTIAHGGMGPVKISWEVRQLVMGPADSSWAEVRGNSSWDRDRDRGRSMGGKETPRSVLLVRLEKTVIRVG